jgi:hypothetical protein
MRRYWGTLALATVAALLGLYVVFVDNPRERARVEQHDREGLVFSLKEEDVAGLEIDTASERLVLERGDGSAWRVTAPVATEADDGTVRRVLNQLTTMSVVRAMEDVGDDAAIGLAKPAVRVVVHRRDGGRAEVAFGETNPTGAGVYVRRDDGKVFLVATAAKSTFEVSRDDIRRKEFVDFRPETVTEIAIGNGKRTLHVRRDGNEWRTDSPARTADPDKVTSLLNRLRALRATAFVDDAEHRDRLRLSMEPRTGIDLLMGDRTMALRFFIAADGSLYARIGGETLYRVSERVVDELPLDAASLRDMRLVHAAFDDAKEVQVERAATTYRLIRGAGGWEIDGQRVEGAAVDAIDAMIRAFTTLRGESVASETVAATPASAFKSPEARVTLRGDGARTLAVVTIGGASGEGRYAYSDPGGPVFVISSHVLDQIPSKSTLEPKGKQTG